MSSVDDTLAQAHSAWELQQYGDAAAMFLRAAEIESAEAETRSRWAAPDRSFLYRLRAAFCRWENGDFEAAAPALREATTFDWKSARLWGDRRDTKRAYAYLLLQNAASNDRQAFCDLWNDATRRGDALQFPFPTVVPLQKKLLVACMSLEFTDGCKQIVGIISPATLKRDHELQLLKSQAEKL